MTPDLARTFLEVLKSRSNVDPTRVVLRDGRALLVFNIAWGIDLGDECAHVTANVSPEQEGADIAFFFCDQIVSLADPDTGAEIISDSQEEGTGPP